MTTNVVTLVAGCYLLLFLCFVAILGMYHEQRVRACGHEVETLVLTIEHFRGDIGAQRELLRDFEARHRRYCQGNRLFRALVVHYFDDRRTSW